MRIILTALLAVFPAHATAQPQAPASSCAVSEDAEFATTRTHAVQVGGGAMYACSGVPPDVAPSSYPTALRF